MNFFLKGLGGLVKIAARTAAKTEAKRTPVGALIAAGVATGAVLSNQKKNTNLKKLLF